MSKDQSSISKDVAFGFLPAKKNDRVFGLWDLILIQVGIGVSCFCLLVGGYTGMIVSAKEAIATILFGNAIPVLLIVPIAIYFARYGIDTFIGFRSSLGYLGSNIFYFIFMILTIGYMSIALFMSGQAVVKIASLLSFPEFFTTRSTGAPFFSIVLFAFAFLVTFKGPLVIRKFNLIGVPAILLVMFGLISILLLGQGLDQIFALRPAEPYEDHSRSIATALELNIGIGFSWLPYFGQYSRLAKSEKSAFNAGFLSYGVFVNVAAILGALTALVVASLDPTDWMIAIGGTWVGLIGLILLTLGNLTATIFLMYSQAISFKTVFPKKRWIFALATAIPTVLLLLSPGFYDAFNSFITVISYIMAVVGGIVISDFFFVKKQRVSIRDLYDTKGSYYYWRGINPSAITSFIVGTIAYWGLYNPLLDTASGMFHYMTAGIPAYFAAGICYYVSAKYVFSYRVDKDAAKSRPTASKEAIQYEDTI
ncbi:purine-cytosine permease family protein [Pseudalkalibacillus decolorationis]|uniref:purine-cytosine permease family protein n=1 Tax=Pseudalkalibacillus decolorationis TaxID=163879 RepID=UPI002147803B|nr:cytosine permease [Pseudalkalibacillus decolorationis]